MNTFEPLEASRKSNSPSAVNSPASYFRVGVLHEVLDVLGQHEIGIKIQVWLGPSDHGRVGASGFTDEHGFYQLDVEPGLGSLLVHPSWLADAPSPALSVRASEVVRLNAIVTPAELAAWRKLHPIEACPNSPPGTVVEGHTTSQADLDDILRGVLARVDSERAIPDLAIARDRGRGRIAVRVDVDGRKRISERALPSRDYVLRTMPALQSDADRTNEDVGYVEFREVYSDGTCAILHVGGDFVMPTRRKTGKLCCCTAHDLYEKRAGRWTFVRRLSETCA